MEANTTDHLQALRQQVADVLERHTEEPDRHWCRECKLEWPCDAATQARRMTKLLDGLGTYAHLIEEIRPYLMRNTETTVDMYIDSVNAAIASAAQEDTHG